MKIYPILLRRNSSDSNDVLLNTAMPKAPHPHQNIQTFMETLSREVLEARHRRQEQRYLRILESQFELVEVFRDGNCEPPAWLIGILVWENMGALIRNWYISSGAYSCT